MGENEFERVRMRGPRLRAVDPAGARFQGVDLTRAAMRGMDLVDVSIAGEIHNVTINRCRRRTAGAGRPRPAVPGPGQVAPDRSGTVPSGRRDPRARANDDRHRHTTVQHRPSQDTKTIRAA
jgi:hypothetical protein